MFWGAILVIFGTLILLNRLDVIHLRLSEFFIPALLIAWGAKLIFKSYKPKQR